MILRCTGKLLAVLGTRPTSLLAREPTDDDWYANLIWLDRRKCLLLVQAGTLFSVFATDVRKAALKAIGAAIVRLVQDELRDEGLPENTFGRLPAGSVTLATTASLVVLGYMNEMVRFCDYAVFQEGGLERCDVSSLDRELRRELHLARRPPGSIVPIEVARDRLSRMTSPEPARHGLGWCPDSDLPPFTRSEMRLCD